MPKSAVAPKAVSRRHIVKAAGALAAGLIAPAVLRIRTALAAYPDRPVKIVVANSPGGPSDITARILAAALQEAMGGSFIVENKGGAGGNIGMGFAARADADGYTLLLITNAYSVNPGLYHSLPYDPFKDFTPICDVAGSPNTFTVKPALGVNTIKEFIALAKTNPAKFNVATPPVGTTPQLQAELLKLRERLQGMAGIVFAGGGEALQALLSDTVQLSSGALPPAHSHIKAGTIKCLVVTGKTRWPDLPDVPTMQEEGFKDFVFATDTALLAPASTPSEIVRRIEKETLGVLARPDIREKLLTAGFQVHATDGKTCLERLVKEMTMFRDIIIQAGIQKL
jgi:tripartite-type tricarboxylate transporter receptor subunit TctC